MVFEVTPGQTIPERALRKGKVVLVKYASLNDEYQFVTPAGGRTREVDDRILRTSTLDRRMIERIDCLTRDATPSRS